MNSVTIFIFPLNYQNGYKCGYKKGGKEKSDLNKFVALIKTYLNDYKGKHIQFNIINKNTLLNAQKHPEKYGSLVVRVAGYSALWVELDSIIQDEIIARTEQTL